MISNVSNLTVSFDRSQRSLQSASGRYYKRRHVTSGANFWTLGSAVGMLDTPCGWQ